MERSKRFFKKFSKSGVQAREEKEQQRKSRTMAAIEARKK
jgi:hypothetical protein